MINLFDSFQVKCHTLRGEVANYWGGAPKTAGPSTENFFARFFFALLERHPWCHSRFEKKKLFEEQFITNGLEHSLWNNW